MTDSDIRPLRVGCGRGPKSVSTNESAHYIAIGCLNDDCITVSFFISFTFNNGYRFTPGEAAVGTITRNDVNVFRKVCFVVFAFVGSC